MKKIILIAVFFVFQIVGFTQINLDSLWKIYNNETETDSTRLMAMWYIAYDGYLYNNPDSSLLLGKQMYDFAVEKDELQFQSYALGTQAVACYYLGKLDSAIAFHEKAFVINTELKNYPAMAASYNNIANIYRERGQLAEALDYFLNSLKIYEKLGNQAAISTVYGNIAAIYSDLREYENAQLWYQKALVIKRETDDHLGTSHILSGIGSCHLDFGNYDSSMYYQLEGLKIRQEINNLNGIANSLKHIAEIYLAKNEPDSAMLYYRKALAYFEPLNLQSGLTDSYTNMARIYEQQDNFADALIYARKAFDIANGSGYLDAERDVSLILFRLYKQKGNYSEALKMHENYFTMRDSMDKEANQKAIFKQQYKYDYDQKMIADSLQRVEEKKIGELKHEKETEKQRILTIAIASGLGLVVLFLIFVFNRLRVTKKQKLVIESQKIEVEKQKDVVEMAHHQLEEKNQEILDSITYAKRIQSAILPSNKMVKEYLKESFILYKPKDIVAGDFYWLEVVFEKVAVAGGSQKPASATATAPQSHILFAAADCTGHGVPGAMVSVICNGALNRTVREFGLTDPGKILDKAREIVIQEFEKSDEEVKDGMDISLCALSLNTRTLNYAGANNPLWIIRKNATELEEIKADKQPIGKYAYSKPFTTNTVQLNAGDSIYIFTDGFQDQFGGDKGKKFKASSLKELLVSIQHESMERQKEIIDEAFEIWRGKLEQVDDVCVIGVRI